MHSHDTTGKAPAGTCRDVRRNTRRRPRVLSLLAARLAALLVLLVPVCNGAWAQPGGQTQYTYTIYFENTGNWSSVNGAVFTSGNGNNWDWQTTYTNGKLTETDSQGRYILSFTTTEDLSARDDVYCQFYTDDWSSSAGYFEFVDGATYNVNGIVTDTGGDNPPSGGGAYNYTIYFEYGSVWWDEPVYVRVWSGNGYGNNTYYTTGSSTYWNNCDLCSLVSGTVYSWTYSSDDPLPEEGVKCEFRGSSQYSWDTGECEFVNGHIYSGNGWHYEYGTLAYDIYYGGNYHSGVEVSEVSIEHKAPKWCGMSDVSHDTFNNDGWTTTENNTPIQAANIYIDTLYVTKGAYIDLDLPYRLGGGLAPNSYQRWFDYRTDGNYRYGDDDDLLTPSLSTNGTSNVGWNSVYRFANGYASGNSMNNSSPLISMTFHYPTDGEFTELRNNITAGTAGNTVRYMRQTDNDYYIVACDVSQYNDFQNFGKLDDNGTLTGDWIEPTLSGRAIYYIVGVDGTSPASAPSNLPSGLDKEWLLLQTDYQGGGNGENDKYLEEYEITYPARRTSNHTLELVTLAKDARAYAVPGAGDTSTELSMKLADTDSGKGFVLVTTTWEEQGTDNWVEVPALKDDRRVIQFYNTTDDHIIVGDDGSSISAASTGAPWSVADGTTATILVTKTIGEGPNATTYNIARFRLTFKEDATPLTQTQVAGLGTVRAEGDAPYWWEDMTYRSPDYMKHNYDKVASLTFDYGLSSDASTVLGGQSGFHAFPMDWEHTSYAFYDGSVGDDVNAQGYEWYPITASENRADPGKRNIYAQWCMYSIVNDYFGYGDSKYMTDATWNDATQKNDTTLYDGNPIRPTEKPGGGENDYWLYIDASDRPGSVAEITFEDDICTGTQIFGTALIKSASEPGSDDAAVMFTIMGVKEENGVETHTPIYRQCSSQIRSTTYLNNSAYGYDDVGETDIPGTITGKGATTNEWFQLYFSFFNSGSGLSYDHYALCVDNYCSSTSGGDYYFDEIQLYVVQPTFIVEQVNPVCTSDDRAASMRLEIDFDMLEARLDDDPDAEEEAYDTVDFMIINMNTYNNYIAENGGDATVEGIVAKAIEASKVEFVYEDGGENKTADYVTLNFHQNYKYNTTYDETNAGENTTTFDGNGYFYAYTINGGEYLAVDCYADISPYTPYKILLLHDEETLTSENYATLFAYCLTQDCEIASDFYLTSSTILKINGEAADPTVDYCAGQTVVIQPEVTYTDEDGNTATLADEYFDWFFGSEEEYTAVNGEYTDEQYTSGVSLEQALLMFRYFYPTATELSETATPPTEDEENNSIAFTQAMYDIIKYYLELENGTSYHAKLVLYKQYFDIVIPTPYLYLVVQPIQVITTDEEGNDTEEICFGYVPITLDVASDAPSLNAGFGNVRYPGDDYVPDIRLGLEQIAKATQTSTSDVAVTPIYVNLRGATYASNDDEITVDHLGLYNSTEDIDELYLVVTDDPYYAEALSDPYFLQYDLPIGKIQELYAKEGDPDASYMYIVFYSDRYPLREGYSYIVMVNCEEKQANGEAVGLACQGTLPIEIKVVPEYLVWTGDGTSNWNNDSNWKRADRSDIHKAAKNADGTYPDDDPYPTNGDNETDNGFVPMLFTKVIMPRDSEAELYMAGFIAGTDNMLSWQGDEDTANHDDVEEDPTENIMYDLMVYENSTQNTLKTEHYRVNLCDEIHFEPGAQLLHSEQLIYNKAWTDVELAQGPWTLAATPLRDVVSGDWYTKKVTGTETAEYFTDIVFTADSCDRLDPMVYQRNWSNSGNTIVYSSGTGKAVPAYATTGWSSVYNDVTVSHQAGEGFSIKASRALPISSTDSLMFRFPKADASYTYQGGTSTSPTIDRTYAGRLLISELVDRTDPEKDGGNVYTKDKITVTLTQTGNDYYIVGNPFTAAMSMSKFMVQNPDVKAYWADSPDGPISGNNDGNNDYLLPPYTGFFITFEETPTTPYAAGSVEVYFTEDMQVLTTESGSTGFHLSAENSVGSSKAYVAYKGSASDSYQLGEDVPLLEDVSWQREGLPMVYTMAGDMAVSINSLRRLALIPVGVFAEEYERYTLSFAGVSKLENPVLIDTYENTETPITEGLTLDMEGPTHGRYFIRTQGMATDIDDIEETAGEVNEVSVYSPVPRTVVVSSDAGLEIVNIYSVGGMLLRRTDAGGSVSCTMDGVASGIAIVRVKTTEGTAVRKIRVR